MSEQHYLHIFVFLDGKIKSYISLTVVYSILMILYNLVVSISSLGTNKNVLLFPIIIWIIAIDLVYTHYLIKIYQLTDISELLKSKSLDYLQSISSLLTFLLILVMPFYFRINLGDPKECISPIALGFYCSYLIYIQRKIAKKGGITRGDFVKFLRGEKNEIL